jgi:hypothetical protein
LKKNRKRKILVSSSPKKYLQLVFCGIRVLNTNSFADAFAKQGGRQILS